MVKVTECKGGLSRSTDYYFVIDINSKRLDHISKYASSIHNKGECIEYEVDLSRLGGKNIIEISVTNSGIICSAGEYPAEDLPLPYDSRRIIGRPLSYLNNFEFTYLEPDEKKFLQGDWKQYYIPMIEQIRNFLNQVNNNKLNLLKGNTSNVYISLPNLIQCQIESGATYPLSYLIPYSDKARGKSLEGLTKEIHQIWTTSRIIEELDKRYALKSLTSSSSNFNFQSLEFKQGSSYPIVTFNCNYGTCSFWYEFDLNPSTMCDGRLWYMKKDEIPNWIKDILERASKILGVESNKIVGIGSHDKRLPLRPDIVILNDVKSCRDLDKVDKLKIRAIIELKNLDIQYWINDIDNQIIPYKQIFQPDIEVVASLKKVPDSIKAKLGRQGIKVIDEVYPGGKGEMELLQIITNL